MSTKNRLTSCLLVIFLTVTGLSLFWAPKVGAFSLPNLLEGVKNLLQPDPLSQSLPQGELTLDSKISLAPNGDVDKNGQVDSGDTVRFEYTINNPTANDYPLATLETNIPRDEINFIRNIQGTANLNQDKNSVTIPNLGVFAHQFLTISFEARINYSEVDLVISTEPRLITSDKKELKKLSKLQVKANKLNKKVPGMVNQQKN